MNKEQRTQVIAEAKSWLNTPYHNNAQVKGAGVDCAQLLVGIYVGAGIVPAFDPGYYPAQFGLHRDEELFLSFVERYATATSYPQPGDCVLFQFGRCYSHGGIMVDDTTIIHAAMRERAVCFASLADTDLASRKPLFFTIEESNGR
jgi:cell wall-associated NlpC family hydrolase